MSDVQFRKTEYKKLKSAGNSEKLSPFVKLAVDQVFRDAEEMLALFQFQTPLVKIQNKSGLKTFHTAFACKKLCKSLFTCSR